MRVRRGAAWALLALLLTLSAAPAAAQDGDDSGWVIDSFDVKILINDDGSLTVEETIEVDFFGLQKHGIYRVIPARYDVADDPSRLRVLRIDAFTVESTAPADLQISQPSPLFDEREVTLRIGDPDRTVSGKQTYVLRYRVRGALNQFDNHLELYWNVTGDGWPVPIRWAHAAVGGGQILRVACYRGPLGSASVCDDAGVLVGAYPAWGTANELTPGEGLTVVVALENGSVQAPEPVYEERRTMARAFTGSPWTWPLAALVAVAVAIGLGRLLWRSGRDRAALYGTSSSGQVLAEHRRRPLGGITVVPEFRPPDGLRPAQLGLLLDERVDPADVSATIVDLAVRGHLSIIEEDKPRLIWFSRTDWLLRRSPDAGDGLLDYERRLLDALFEDGDEVYLSDLKGEFATSYELVSGDIEDDAVARHWFGRRPSDTRTSWLFAGLGGIVVAAGLIIAAALFTTFAMAAVPLLVGALVLAVAHRHMPARTSKGSHMLARAMGFREYIRKAEVDRMEFAEAERTFVEYLPYAVAFGAVDHWAKTFAALGVTGATVGGGWYVSPHGFGDGGLVRMSSGLSEFSRAVGGSLPVAPESSGGSGFGGGGSSGGGFGGGGGGSW